MTRVTLTSPIQRGDETISFLEFRAPTGKDIRACGMPIDGRGEIAAASVARFMSELGAVPPSTIDSLSAHDWQNAAVAVLGFFGPPTHKIS